MPGVNKQTIRVAYQNLMVLIKVSLFNGKDSDQIIMQRKKKAFLFVFLMYPQNLLCTPKIEQAWVPTFEKSQCLKPNVSNKIYPPQNKKWISIS